MYSFRRKHLDKCLENHVPLMKGKVLDLGGKKINSRGSFIPPVDQVVSWQYLNTDKTTKPDFCCSIEKIPLENESINTVIMTEVLEYLPDPILVFKEIRRVLSTNGYAFISTPLLNPIHGDHWADRARYTPVMLKEYIEKAGLKIQTIDPMGSVGSVIFDTLRVALGYAKGKSGGLIWLRALGFFRPVFSIMDKICSNQTIYINTGYFIIIKKEK